MATTMELAALLGSRICHDLISPLGAIGNGVELLEMSGVASGPEMTLISESVENANARIRLLRVAFGAASPGQMIGRSEIRDSLAGIGKSGRLVIDWQGPAEILRAEAKLALLCLQCLETAMPWGGQIEVTKTDDCWTIRARAEKLRDIAPLWACFDAPDTSGPLSAAEIQFLIAPLWAREIQQELERQSDERGLRLSFRPF